MDNFSILIGGRAGDGINQSGMLLAQIMSRLGRRIYMYFDYPSLIRGGHNFSIVRASTKPIAAHCDRIDFLLALNQEAIDLHKDRLGDPANIIFDSDRADSRGLGLPLKEILQREKAPPITGNTVIIGAFAKSIGLERQVLEEIIKENTPKETELNVRLAATGYEEAQEKLKLQALDQSPPPILTGSEIIGSGLIGAGLESYVAYPMTPSSGVLHFMAASADKFNLKVIHPENEIAVILMALGLSYGGKKVAVGTSGGGFCLMTEGVGLSGMAELPVVIIVAQRAGPSTGVPTYSAQADLNFVLNAGHGEFPRFVAAPGDPEQAFYWSAMALNLAWKYQLPALILTDKTLTEGAFSFDEKNTERLEKAPPLAWNGKGEYRRYAETATGVSPLASVPEREAVIKVNSYEHDEKGITTENAGKVARMYDKRLRKTKHLAREINDLKAVNVCGDKNSDTALLCWGSNIGVCREVAAGLGLKVIQPVVLEPFPLERFQQALHGTDKIIAVENNAGAQLCRLIKMYGFDVRHKILKFDGRPFSVNELEQRIKEVIHEQ